MSPLSVEELAELRKHIESFPMSQAEKDEMITLIDRIVVSFILQARGLDPVRLSLSARANAVFDGNDEYAMKDDRLVTLRVDLGNDTALEGEIDDAIDHEIDVACPNKNPRRIIEP
jgi:hypothetical protein